MYKSAVLLAALCALASASLDFSRTVTKVASGSSAKVTFDKGCSQTDPYGSNDCSLDWGSDYTVTYNATFPPITSGHKIAIALKVDGIIPFDVTCPACGGNCEFEVPIIKKQVNISLPPCPITSQVGSQHFTLPSDPLPVKVSIEGTVSLLDPTGATTDSISLTVEVEK
eukprot:m.168266 g.168266  ORF g.168266 m.168266 type:complete len:169 (-) comp12934_c0_seq1:146-652(-)